MSPDRRAVRAAATHIGLFGRRHRRHWSRDGLAYIELRRSLERDAFHEHLTSTLGAVHGVQWAAVNDTLARVVIAYDEDDVGADDLVDVVGYAEDAFGLTDRSFETSGPSTPGDPQHVLRPTFALTADVLATGASLTGMLLHWTPLPVEAAAAVSLLDSHPRVRHVLAAVAGPTVADAGLAAAQALGQALGQGPVGLGVDLAHRGLQLAAARRQRDLWCSLQPRLAADPGLHASPLRLRGRPVPLPRGPVERYADRIAVASFGAFGVALAATRRPRRSASLLLAATPKPARLGREAFGSFLAAALARRDVLALQADALRHLDRIDCVAVDAPLLVSRWSLGAVECPDDDVATTRGQLLELFDETDPFPERHAAGWTLRVAPPSGPAGRGEPRDAPLVELWHDGRRAAHARLVAADLSREAIELVTSARANDLMVVAAGAGQELAQRCGAQLAVAGGDRLEASIRALQADGCVVAVVADRDAGALRSADCGIGVHRGDPPPWGADFLCPGLDEARFVVEAMGAAAQASHQSVALSLTGTSLASLIALNARLPGSTARGLMAVNAAAALAVANGVRAAWTLDRAFAPLGSPAPPWHDLDADDVVERLDTTPAGLAPDAIAERIPDASGPSPAPLRFLRAVGDELANPLTPVLAAGAAASATIGSMVDAAMVGAVVALNGVIGGAQRFQAETTLDALETRRVQHTRVRRGGSATTVAADDVVPGDVVVLEAGEVVPADLRLLDARNLEAEESTLTGESLAVAKATPPAGRVPVAERSSMLYAGTTVAAGEAVGVAVAVGDRTEAAGDRRDRRGAPAEGVEARLQQLGRLALPTAVAGGAAVVASGLLRGRSLRATLGSGVSLAVAAVPEGLPILSTFAQLAAAKRLARAGALVRNNRSVEALGRVDVLCIDKTGTLTEGRIRLRRVSDGRHVEALDDLGAATRAVLMVARRATPDPNGGRAVPHATDRAVLGGAEEAGVTLDGDGWQRRDDLPFETGRGYHASVGVTDADATLSVKGAPEVVLPRCSTWRVDGDTRALDRGARDELAAHVEALARSGQRVLAAAERPWPIDGPGADALTEEAVTGLVLVGFVGLSDPVRPEAASAVRVMQRAGVDVVMVTGDHPSTAEGVATELGIANGHRVVTGDELDDLGDHDFDALLPDVSVFARVTPAHKRRIVEAFQRAERPVAMTGDGANDAPAIRLADVGIAIGERSTAAARNAADVVITTNRIETIVDAVIEGRSLWRSLREALGILIGGNLGEMGFTVLGAALTGRAPLSARQLLLVNLLTDVAPALAVANRPPHPDAVDALLGEGPDRSLGSTLSRAIVLRAGATAAGAAGAWLCARATGTRRHADTVGLVALIGTQLGQTLTAGDWSPAVLAAGLGSAAVVLAVVETPVLSQAFDCRPLGPVGLTIAVGSATAATIAVGVVAPRLTAPPVDRSQPSR